MRNIRQLLTTLYDTKVKLRDAGVLRSERFTGELGEWLRTILEERYSKLFTELFSGVKRSWMSATSKLLWCIYPNEVVIYDSFVKGSLVVMQCLEGDLAEFPRINVAPRVKQEADITSAVKHYMNFQDVVKQILKQYSGILKELRESHNETYPHDIRIVDKLLWMIGNPKYGSSDQ